MLTRIARVALLMLLLAGPIFPPHESPEHLPVPPFVAVVTERLHEHGAHLHSELENENRQLRSTSGSPGSTKFGAVAFTGTGRLTMKAFSPTVTVGRAAT